jgi:hypothetical protein
MRNGFVPASPCRWVHLHAVIVVFAVIAASIQSVCAVAPAGTYEITASATSTDALRRGDT